MEKSLLIAGSIAIDSIETPNDKRENILGGSVTHALIPSGKRVPVFPVGIVGSDFSDEGSQIYETFSETTENIQCASGNTFSWGGRYHENWDKRDTLFTELGVFEDYKPEITETARSADVIFLANIHPALQLSVLEQCSPRLVITDSMNLWIDTAKEKLLEVLNKTDIFLVNEDESQQLTEKDGIEEAAADILQLGPETVIIKKGSSGSAVFTNDECTCIPAVSGITVQDPTGAGDTFGGGMAASLVLGESLIDAVSSGTAWASACVEGFGIEMTIKIDSAEIEQRKSEILGAVSSC